MAMRCVWTGVVSRVTAKTLNKDRHSMRDGFKTFSRMYRWSVNTVLPFKGAWLMCGFMYAVVFRGMEPDAFIDENAGLWLGLVKVRVRLNRIFEQTFPMAEWPSGTCVAEIFGRILVKYFLRTSVITVWPFFGGLQCPSRIRARFPKVYRIHGRSG